MPPREQNGTQELPQKPQGEKKEGGITRRQFLKTAAVAVGAAVGGAFLGPDTAQAGDPNNPDSANYRGYTSHITTFGGGQTVLNMTGQIPYEDRFNAFGEYDLVRVYVNKDEPAPDTPLAGPWGVMRTYDVVKGDERVGQAYVYYLKDWYTAETRRQSYAVGFFKR